MSQLLPRGNGRSYTTCLIIGTPASSDVAPGNFIIDVHPDPTYFSPSENISNPVINIPIPDTDNSAQNKAIQLNLRCITEKIAVTGYIFDTQNDTDELFDNTYIEATRGSIFNGTTGAVTQPPYDYGNGVGGSNTLTDSSKSWTVNQWIGYKLRDSKGVLRNILGNTATTVTVALATPASGAYLICSPQLVLSALTKKWMLKQLAKAGPYANLDTGLKELLTVQIYGIYNPSGELDKQNIFHQTMTIDSLQIYPIDGAGNVMVNVNDDDMSISKFKVVMSLIWGDPNA